MGAHGDLPQRVDLGQYLVVRVIGARGRGRDVAARRRADAVAIARVEGAGHADRVGIARLHPIAVGIEGGGGNEAERVDRRASTPSAITADFGHVGEGIALRGLDQAIAGHGIVKHGDRIAVAIHALGDAAEAVADLEGELARDAALVGIASSQRSVRTACVSPPRGRRQRGRWTSGARQARHHLAPGARTRIGET